MRFEGPGTSATTVRGHLHEARITVIDGDERRCRAISTSTSTRCRRATAPRRCRPAVKEASLATPLDMALASDGTLYVAAFGSSAVGVFDAAELEDDTFVPDAAHHIAVSGGGPSGLALDEANHRLYVLTRFDNAVKVIDTDDRAARSPSTRCTIPSRRRSSTGGASSTTRASRRATARRRARAATSSPTSTASPGTSATPTTSVEAEPQPVRADRHHGARSIR